MAPRRTREHDSFTQLASQKNDLYGRLDVAEAGIRSRISDVDRLKSIYFFQAGLNNDEYEWIFLQLRQLIPLMENGKGNAERLVKKYPRLFIASLVATATSVRTTTAFWPLYWDNLGIEPNPKLENFLRQRTPWMFSVTNLHAFKGSDLGAKKFVSLYMLNAGITEAALPKLVEMIREVPQNGQSSEDSIPALRARILNSGSNSALVDTVQFSEPIVDELLARITEIVCAFDENHELFSEFGEGVTNGLPQPTFASLRGLLLNDSTGGSDSSFFERRNFERKPKIAWDLNSGELQLALPSIVSAKAGSWIVQMDAETFPLDVQPNSEGIIEALNIPIPLNTAFVSATNQNSGQNWEFTLSGADNRCLFFGKDGVLLHQSHFRGSRIGIAIPANSIVTGVTPENVRNAVQPRNSFDVTNWRGWNFGLYDVQDFMSIEVESASGRTASLSLASDNSLAWNFKQASKIEGVCGADEQPVYSSSPSIVFPATSEDDIWTINIVYFPPNADPEAYEPIDIPGELKSHSTEVFSDGYEDAWLGHYEIRVFLNGLHKETRTVNFAEGVSASIHYQGTHGSFQAPDINSKSQRLTGASIQFANRSGKNLRFDGSNLGPQNCSRKNPARFSTPEGSEFDMIFTPARLEYYLPFESKRAAWQSNRTDVSFDELDMQRGVRFRFPDRVHSPQIQAFNEKTRRQSEKVALSKVNKSIWEFRVADLFSYDERHGKWTLVLTWETETVKTAYETYRVQQKQRRVPGDSFWEFQKHYQPKTFASTVFKLNFGKTLKGASITEHKLSLELGRSAASRGSALETPVALIWPLLAPPTAPVELPISGTELDLPAELDSVGPLVVDFATRNLFAGNTVASRPSKRAVLADQPGEYVELDNPLSLNSMMLGGHLSGDPRTTEELTQNAIQLQDQWMHVFETYRHSKKVFDLQSRLRTFVESAPREALDSLEYLKINQELLSSVFINSGLAQLTFKAEETYDEFGPVPWLELLDEMNDLNDLKSIRFGSEERQEEWRESVDYVRNHGGATLIKILQASAAPKTHIDATELLGRLRKTPVDLRKERMAIPRTQLVSHDSYQRALFQLLEARAEVKAKVSILKLKEVADHFEHLLIKLSNNRAAIRANELRSLAQDLSKAPGSQGWIWVPYISFVFACLSRAIAHGLLRPIPELNSHVSEWSLLARRVPELVEFDLVISEAIALSNNRPVLNVGV